MKQSRRLQEMLEAEKILLVLIWKGQKNAEGNINAAVEKLEKTHGEMEHILTKTIIWKSIRTKQKAKKERKNRATINIDKQNIEEVEETYRKSLKDIGQRIAYGRLLSIRRSCCPKMSV